ncbi:MAG: tail fiber protein [Victivallaceae bacterium]|nr:tail fiber protein [Victivallaceae bacterium]
MADSFTGEIRMFPYASLSRIPTDWALCNGDVLQVAQNSALAAVIGKIYGGDGKTTFQLPDLQERVPMHPGTGPGLSPHSLAEESGVAAVLLGTTQLPAHTHGTKVLHEEADQSDPANNYLGYDDAADVKVYEPATTPNHVAMSMLTLTPMGGNSGHENRQPFVALHFCISLNGHDPSRP